MLAWQVQCGDEVTVQMDQSDNGWFSGIVRHYPQSPGEYWVIESEMEYHYVQTFARIVRKKAARGGGGGN